MLVQASREPAERPRGKHQPPAGPQYARQLAPARHHRGVALPQGVHPPSAWADEATARRRLEPLLEGLERRTRTAALAFESPGAMFAAFRAALGLGQEVRPAFDRLLAAQNNRPPAAEIDARYALYTGRRGG